MKFPGALRSHLHDLQSEKYVAFVPLEKISATSHTCLLIDSRDTFAYMPGVHLHCNCAVRMSISLSVLAR
jgi:hypothetical protein